MFYNSTTSGILKYRLLWSSNYFTEKGNTLYYCNVFISPVIWLHDLWSRAIVWYYKCGTSTLPLLLGQWVIGNFDGEPVFKTKIFVIPRGVGGSFQQTLRGEIQIFSRSTHCKHLCKAMARIPIPTIILNLSLSLLTICLSPA